MRGYMSTTEAAIKWEMSQRRVSVLCVQGRIPGAEFVGGRWIVPINAVRPVDARIKSGKYIKRKEDTEH